MIRKIEVEYSFEKNSSVLERESQELKEYEIHFEKEMIPEIQEIERRKIEAREKAYRIFVSAACSVSIH